MTTTTFTCRNCSAVLPVIHIIEPVEGQLNTFAITGEIIADPDEAVAIHIIEPVSGKENTFTITGEIEYECKPCEAAYIAQLEAEAAATL